MLPRYFPILSKHSISRSTLHVTILNCCITKTCPCNILRILMVVKITIFISKFWIFFPYCKSTFIRGYLFSRFYLRGRFRGNLIFAQNIVCGAVLTSTHNLCFMAKMRWFWHIPTIYILSKNKKKNVYPCKPHFYYIKVGSRGYTLHGHVSMIRSVKCIHQLSFHINSWKKRWVAFCHLLYSNSNTIDLLGKSC